MGEGGDSNGSTLLEEIKDATVGTVTLIPKVASSVTSTFVPDILPDAEKIDNMVDTANMACYALIAFGVSGTLLFSLRTVREIGQWRQWYKFRNILRTKSQKNISTPEKHSNTTVP